ncbi:TIGR04141 family sporadically distributed protein [Burkholderia sp. AU39826]|uniref:TIGR04141 family sporadically distributed protein n=1 Tax=Burkholderia sp. AU39826 TaxID=2879634 RepID=UPI001CF1D13D|nr:TIGR04141 family sporadically distributed protein [Burkholderia sp. AU39826]MCA7971859.1 TIGR04141 family sporadically distributed protein [Burkholderia sp. AU39826]
MTNDNGGTRLSASIYLLKKSKTDEALELIKSMSIAEYPLDIETFEGALYELPAATDTPKWRNLLTSLLLDKSTPSLQSQYPGALLWIWRGGKTFLFTFGYGHTKVKSEWIEPDFGKIVVQAVVPQGQLREVRAEQVFARRHIASERAPRAAAIREFGFEADRDLVAGMEGVPEDCYKDAFGGRVSGATSFKFELSISKLNDTLDLIIQRYDSNEHRSRWPQANNLVPVKDEDKILRLNTELEKILSHSNPEQKISLSAPTERNGDSPYAHHFVIGRMTKNVATSPYLTFSSWQSYLSSKGYDLNVDSAKSTAVHLLDEEKNEFAICSLYQCIGTEVDLNKTTHVLSSGIWYSTGQKFIKDTNITLSTLTAPALPLINWNFSDHEGDYNIAACSVNSDLWLFDKELINFGGGASRFEFCDIMHLPTKTLYFVKHPAGSAGVSHLCEQVRRTAEIFFSPDPGYREKLLHRVKAVGKGWSVDWMSTQPKRHEWNLCLVLMGKNLNQLPFFAKCGIARLLRELEKGGFNVQFQAV